MSKAKKFYVVWEGIKPGIYTTWSECEAQVKGFKGARYKSYTSEVEAIAAFKGEEVSPQSNGTKDYIEDSISTDAACSGNPGELEFRGVHTKNGEQIFHFGPFPIGTNNLGEFLGIVHGLKFLKSKGETNKPLYADSQTAITWVKNKNINTNLPRNQKTEKLWIMLDEAMDWLESNEYKNPILKWNTPVWGEIKADFGRK